MGVLGLALVLYILMTIPPAGNPLYPKCVSFTLFGLHCPGCGTTRALHALLNGRFQQSLAYNIAALPALFYFGLVALRWAWQWCWGYPLRSWTWPRILIWLTLGLFVLYGVVRNLPVAPFNLLAPHQLSE